jgi:glycosyltransferase 2 family protein
VADPTAPVACGRVDPRASTSPTAPPIRTLVAALVVVVGTVLLVRTPPSAWERALARAVYERLSALTGVLEVVMQAGSRGAIAVVAVVLVVLRRLRVAVAVLVGGWLAWLAAIVAKDVVERARPTSALLERPVREVVEGSGYPSSHAAIAAALAAATVLGLRLRPLPAAVAVAVAVLTAVARVHLGVHWPLDVLGGAALGVAAGTVGVVLVERRPR